MSHDQERPVGVPATPPARTKKSVLIGINYCGSKNELKGCHRDVSNMRKFINAQGHGGWHRQITMCDDETSDIAVNMWPTAHNIGRAMEWLLRDPNTCAFFHYSGHGGQYRITDHHSQSSRLHDTIVPVDFKKVGQISSRMLHEALVTALKPHSTLVVIFDCCHSGSILELPYVYRSDEEGKVSLIDNVEASMLLIDQASHLIQGDSNTSSLDTAKQLLAGATSFFHSLMHEEAQETDHYGLGKQDNASEYQVEGKRNVWMYSGCRDDQTSSDASIEGGYVGAMSWAFLECMREYGREQSFLEVLQRTRRILAGRFSQVPQLSVGYEQDLNFPIPW